jgi:3'-phosphoadenosine 5'-phosphosulfate sulfotransferase (PAPS reductase)/FAD synthetase
VWEEDKKTFNPLADWSWADVCEYVLKNDVPYNALHRRLSLADNHVYPTERDTSKELRHVDLDEPFFAYDDEWINAHARMEPG